jgi:histidinol dehydrogenase
MIEIIRAEDKEALNVLLAHRETGLEEAEAVVRPILDDVRREGDAALVRYTEQLDGIDLRETGFTVSEREIKAAHGEVPPDFIPALRTAARNIRKVALKQVPKPWRVDTTGGVQVSQVVRPLGRVACYIPGGRFPLPSTVLMSAIPAKAAGVPEIVLTSPRPAPAVLVAAQFLGVGPIFRLGGAQAIAAFAFGTESVPKVDRIVGPGNRYVAAAKKLLAGQCGIDFVAGPSELVVVGTESRTPENARWIASDLIAQAEHDPDASAFLITPSTRLALGVQAAVEQIRSELNGTAAGAETPAPGSWGRAEERPGEAQHQAPGRCAVILTRSLEEALELVNAIAPEHLTLLDDAAEHLESIQSAGSIFLGEYSPVAAGDYASGTNHILPTGGAARLRGGLSAADFVKTITVQQLSRAGLARLRDHVVTLANTEGLKAHGASIEERFVSKGEEGKREQDEGAGDRGADQAASDASPDEADTR